MRKKSRQDSSSSGVRRAPNATKEARNELQFGDVRKGGAGCAVKGKNNEGVPGLLGYFEFSRPGEMEATSMAMDQELRIATASNESIPAATKVSPRWGARRDRTPPNTRSP